MCNRNTIARKIKARVGSLALKGKTHKAQVLARRYANMVAPISKGLIAESKRLAKRVKSLAKAMQTLELAQELDLSDMIATAKKVIALAKTPIADLSYTQRQEIKAKYKTLRSHRVALLKTRNAILSATRPQQQQA